MSMDCTTPVETKWGKKIQNLAFKIHWALLPTYYAKKIHKTVGMLHLYQIQIVTNSL